MAGRGRLLLSDAAYGRFIIFFSRHPSPQPRGDGGYSIDTQKGFRERLGIEIVTREDRKRASKSLKGGWSNRELGVHAALIFFLAFFLAVGAFTDQGPFIQDIRIRTPYAFPNQ